MEQAAVVWVARRWTVDRRAVGAVPARRAVRLPVKVGPHMPMLLAGHGLRTCACAFAHPVLPYVWCIVCPCCELSGTGGSSTSCTPAPGTALRITVASRFRDLDVVAHVVSSSEAPVSVDDGY
jgi:hypothetical protein